MRLSLQAASALTHARRFQPLNLSVLIADVPRSSASFRRNYFSQHGFFFLRPISYRQYNFLNHMQNTPSNVNRLL